MSRRTTAGRLRAAAAAGVLALVAGLAVAPHAAAQESRAQELFREGRAAMEARDWDTACARFEESLTLEASIGSLLNLAECSEKQLRLVRAIDLWSQGLAKMPADDGRRELAQRKIAELERRVPKLLVRAPQGARVYVDGTEVKPNEPVRVDPGRRSVVITGTGPSRTITVDAVEVEVLPIDATTAEPPETTTGSPTAPPRAAAGDQTFPAIISFAVGGAGLVGFAVTGGLYLREDATVDEQCEDGVCATAEGVEAGDARTTYGVLNAVTLGFGLLGVGVGTVLLLQSGDDDGPSARLTARGTGMAIDGRF